MWVKIVAHRHTHTHTHTHKHAGGGERERELAVKPLWCRSFSLTLIFFTFDLWRRCCWFLQKIDSGSWHYRFPAEIEKGSTSSSYLCTYWGEEHFVWRTHTSPAHWEITHCTILWKTETAPWGLFFFKLQGSCFDSIFFVVSDLPWQTVEVKKKKRWPLFTLSVQLYRLSKHYLVKLSEKYWTMGSAHTYLIIHW